MLRRTLTGLALAVTLTWASSASALTSVEGTAIGDQGFYWTTPAEAWIFPHRIGNIDNRVMLQWNGLTSPSPMYNLDGLLNNTGGLSSIQAGPGGGFIVELIQDLNLGLWLSTYNPGHNTFVTRGIAATTWNQYLDSLGDMQALNAATGYPTADQAGRKVDLFISYWLSDLDIEAGFRFWYGSASAGYLPDESNGPVNIDTDSDPANDTYNPGDPFNGRDDALNVERSTYGVSDLGFGLGAGWRGIEGVRADLGFNVNLLGVSWEPNGIGNYVDIGGSAFSVNARGHFDLSDKWTVGAFARFSTASMGLQPQMQRDGGDLLPLAETDPADPNFQANLPDPTAVPPNDHTLATATTTDETVSEGAKYEEGALQTQVAALINFRPVSRAKLYGAVGFRLRSFSEKTSIRNLWSAENSYSWMTLPFIHLGAEGKIFDWLDMFIGASKQWRGRTTVTTYIDNRIPDNPDALVGPGVATGSEDYTNANRREIKTERTLDNAGTSTTSLMVGTRIHYKAFQLVAHMNPNFLLQGPDMLSGAGTPGNNMFGWVALIYDWDYDLDTEYGNGTIGATSPHSAEPAPARDDLGHERKYTPAPEPTPAPAPEPAPEPEYEEFDS